MGCCQSSAVPSRKPSHISQSTKSTNRFSKSPPPTHPIVEEEAVKEVLLETPSHYQNRPNQSLYINSSPQLPDFSTIQNGVVRSNKPSTANDDHSEICSDLSETTSISTAVVDNNKNEARRRSPVKSRNRPYSGEIKIRERSVGVSPGRRSDSPNRSGYGRKRESGEISGRRSRSPAATRAEGAVTGPVRKAGRSPGRVGTDRIRKVEEGKEGGGIGCPPTGNESLENPLVSLECFIFL